MYRIIKRHCLPFGQIFFGFSNTLSGFSGSLKQPGITLVLLYPFFFSIAYTRYYKKKEYPRLRTPKNLAFINKFSDRRKCPYIIFYMNYVPAYLFFRIENLLLAGHSYHFYRSFRFRLFQYFYGKRTALDSLIFFSYGIKITEHYLRNFLCLIGPRHQYLFIYFLITFFSYLRLICFKLIRLQQDRRGYRIQASLSAYCHSHRDRVAHLKLSRCYANVHIKGPHRSGKIFGFARRRERQDSNGYSFRLQLYRIRFITETPREKIIIKDAASEKRLPSRGFLARNHLTAYICRAQNIIPLFYRVKILRKNKHIVSYSTNGLFYSCGFLEFPC